MSTLLVKLVTPLRTVLEREVLSATLPTVEGEITVLPGHIPFVTTLASGEGTLRTTTGDEYVALSGGVVEMDGTGMRILADSAERSSELDLTTVQAAVAAAAEAMSRKETLSDEDYARVAAALEREGARLRVARRHVPENLRSLD